MNGEDYFCTTHGCKLNAGFRCEECENSEDKKLKYSREYGILNLEKCFVEKGNKWIDEEELINSKRKSYFYVCTTCKNFLHHQVIWCYRCGQKRVDLTGLTWKEFSEKYPDYKQGC